MSSHLKEYLTISYWKTLLVAFFEATKTKKFWWELVLMTVGMLFGAAAVYYFLMPSHLIVGTISGLSIVINTVLGGTPDTFSYWATALRQYALE